MMIKLKSQTFTLAEKRTTAKREENYMKNYKKVKISTFIVKKITKSQKN